MAELQYDVVVIGGGPGGYVSAIRAAQLGLKTALIEKDHLGGICLNWGCIPSKALLSSAGLLDVIKKAHEFGISFDNLRFDFAKAIARSRGIVERLTKGVEFLLKKNKVVHITGLAKLSDPHTISVNGGQTVLTSHNIIIATGAVNNPIKDLEIDGVNIISSKEALVLPEVPKSLVVVGAGATGVEFSYLYRAFGSEVTLVEMQSQILPAEDQEIAEELRKCLSKQGIHIFTEARVQRNKDVSGLISLNLQVPGHEERIEAEKVLMATGVKGNTDKIGLEDIGLTKNRGFINVNEKMQTGIPHIYAVGDVTGRMLLAHVAQTQGVIAAETIAGKITSAIDYTNMPRAVYCEPQVTSFGYTEKEAIELGHEIRIGKFPFLANAKAAAIGETEGTVKLVIDATNEQIIGAHLIGNSVTEILPELMVTKLFNGKAEDLAYLTHSHPSLSEAIKEATLAAYGKALHI